MAINILQMVQGAIGNQGIGQIGQILGEDQTKTATAISSALPAIVGGLMKQSSTPSGANQLFETVRNADGNMLSNLSGALAGGKHTNLIQTGMGLISWIFGANQSGLISSIARMAGIGQNSTGSLLGMLAPIVISALSNLRSKENLDAGGLSDLLSSQKAHVNAALPAELRGDLGLDTVLGQTGDAIERTGAAAADSARRGAPDAGSSGMLRKVLPVVVLAGLAWLGYKYLLAPEPESVVASDKARLTNEVKGATMNVDELTSKVTTSIGDLTTTLSGITDEASAKNAIDQLKGATASLSELGLDGLSGTTKTSIGGVAGPLLDKLKGALETAYAIPGVKAVIEPIVSPVIGQLDALVA